MDSLTRTQRALITVVVLGAVIIAAIGFAGSYTAVRELAERKGFGAFSAYFPLGVDAGIACLLSMDLLLTWLRIPLPLLRQAAWLLTAATIAFNAASAWPDPISIGMHATIPVLFVVTVEAARHAVGRLAAITADRHMEGVRLARWILAPLPTFLLWRKMRLWEIREYSQIIKAEQDRLVYEAQLEVKYGRRWRRRASLDELLPLRLARVGVPLAAAIEASGSQRDGATPARNAVPVTPAPDHSALATPRPRDAPSSLMAEQHEQHERPGPTEQPKQHEQPEPTEQPKQHEQPEPTEQPKQHEQPGPTEQPKQHEQPEPTEQPKQHEPGGVVTSAVEGTPGPSEAIGSALTRAGADSSPASVAQEQAGQNEELADLSEHRRAVARARTNADAIRHAFIVNPGADDSSIVNWLAQLGREVNRGQVYKVRRQPARG
ncbi:DUF2637 domain-containing protein [Streptomyces rubiginosohelvolus]|uniref:DUF2637 domain-containing protein n=1 Tax=Streptomyces rubiginosohelvolus TaxID=67362 RepID=UPI003F4B3FA4